jgi:hypothetical protein
MGCALATRPQRRPNHDVSDSERLQPSGREFIVPTDFEAPLNAVAIAFQAWQQAEVDSIVFQTKENLTNGAIHP